ncbi:MAG: hypothetical protein ABIA77_02795, partial [Candidatus Omnitrophota bacterium]
MNSRIKKHVFLVRAITTVTVFSFLFQVTVFIAPAAPVFPRSSVETLAPVYASQNAPLKREIRAALERTRIVYAESQDAKQLLKKNNTHALLLSSGKYLVSGEVAENDIKLIRAIIHEDIETLMQILREDDRYRYNGIKELILPRIDVMKTYCALCPAGKKPDLPHELVLNDIIAKAFEIILTRDKGYIQTSDMSPEEITFLDKIEPVIRSNRHNYFTADFRDPALRGEKIRLALSRGYTFLQTANRENITSDPVDKKASGQTIRVLPVDKNIILEQKLNLLKAYEGHELADDEIGLARANIATGAKESGVCCVFRQLYHRKNGKRAQFAIPAKYMDKGALGKPVIIKVVRDPNRGQVINVYFESDFMSSEHPIPIVMYKCDKPGHDPSDAKTRIRRPINPGLLDIKEYRAGNTDIEPVEDRVLELRIFTERDTTFTARFIETFSKTTNIRFQKLSPAAKDIFDSKKKRQKAYARIRKDPDYGSYIEIFKDNVILGRYYYFNKFSICADADFPRMALIDHIHGEPVRPREYHHRGKISDKGELNLTYRGKTCVIRRLSPLTGKKPVLIPVKNEKYGYTILIHDASEYEKNRTRAPDMILVKKDKTLIPLAILRAREYIDKGHFTIARDILERFIRKVPKNREAR